MKGLEGKKVLIVAAGAWQVPLIKKAKEMKLIVISTDRDPNAPGFTCADFHEVVDIIDIEGTLKVAEKYEIDSIITDQSDLAVPTVAYVAEKLGLPGIGYNVALKATNKLLMREYCRNANIVMPKFREAQTIKQALDSANEIGYPVVIKPLHNQSSRGVFVIADASEMKELFSVSMHQSRDKKILVEEKLTGSESSVEGFITSNGPVVLAIAEKKVSPPPRCITTSILYAPSYDKQTIDSIVQMNSEVIKAIGIPMGITHAEFIVTDEGPRLLEIAARGGGTKISSHVVPAVSGIDVEKGLIIQSLGYNFDIDFVKSNPVALEYFIFREGKLKMLKGLNDVKQREDIIDFDIELTIGNVIKPVENGRGRHGYFIAVAKSRSDILQIVESVKRRIKAEIE